MKISIPTTREEEVTHVHVILPVNYEQEEIPNGFPLRKGDSWSAMIEIDTGRILDWPAGRSAVMFLTVKDGGSYSLLNAKGDTIASIEDDYVPHRIIPGSYGDTVELNISAEGIITNWPKNPDASDFFKDES